MKKLVDQRERAKRAWDILAGCARSKQHTTYGELGKRMGVHHRVCQFFLGLIQDHCLERGLPPLQSLVVNKISGRPGEGYIATSAENIQQVHERVYAHDWSTAPNPF